MPHAIQIRQTGGPEILNWAPIKVGEPGSDQVRLRQAGARATPGSTILTS
jgi:NADPH2:quinone reductase